MNFAWFVANRITFKSKRTFSKLIVRIAIIGIMLGLGVMILSLGIVRGFKSAIREKVRGFSGDMVIVKNDLNGSLENSPFKANPDLEKKVSASPLITRMMPYATKPGIIKAKGDIEGIVLKGVDKTYDWSVFKKNLVSGHIPDLADTATGKKQLLISKFVANRLQLKPGDKVLIYFVQEPLRVRPFVISGVFSFGIDEVDKTYVVGDISLINRLNNWAPDEIGGYELKVADFNRLNAAEDAVNDLLPARLKAYTIMDNYPAIFAWLDLLDGNTSVVLSLMIIVAVINMISALLIMILERTNMIGILKAMGAANWTIQKVFLFNALYLICLGMLLGNAFGLGIEIIQYNTHIFQLDPASYYMNFVPIQFKWTDLLLLNAGTFLVCLLVMIGPSMLVTKITPVKAIRFK
ncbi:ABC transporter permease [Mucilaginibacter gotjawali]|uniref:Lipoprotein-releasing system transmembrane protein LolE n=2 Tax=Mucilaginibacter gotjawali TaxID=1550579 RepID=A0A0X8X056_9SPHI|nr:FtsX-like permease family protein [Mucilaginibacter gotjawali]MBB3055308.1 lipoprotein-releasing system permease protein [Mucilaginibacter gotjawali]BAU53415.1 Lipoprotein-releasing system transmembrane protein LolE [Mucilaginibacter gotjawali]